VAPIQVDIVKLQNAVAINRDEAAYRQLFLLFYSPVIRFSKNIVHSEETAEELYVDMMMKIWLMGDKLEQIENLKVYLYTIIKNASLNHLKAQKK
jgi:DNA-directed RNA polymerase specialized sigma24 family protein